MLLQCNKLTTQRAGLTTMQEKTTGRVSRRLTWWLGERYLIAVRHPVLEVPRRWPMRRPSETAWVNTSAWMSEGYICGCDIRDVLLARSRSRLQRSKVSAGTKRHSCPAVHMNAACPLYLLSYRHPKRGRRIWRAGPRAGPTASPAHLALVKRPLAETVACHGWHVCDNTTSITARRPP